MHRADLQRAVVALAQAHRGVADRDGGLAFEHVEAFFERVDVRREDATGVELRNAQPGMHRAGVRPDKLKIGTVVTCTNCSRSKNPESMNVNGRLTTEDGKPFLAAVPNENN